MNKNIVNPNTKELITEQRFIMSNTLRERYIEHTEVLDKVKPLLLIPHIECITAMQIASYYEVSEGIIFAYYDDYRKEFTSDGAGKYTFAEVIHTIELHDTTSSLVKRCKGRAEIKVAEDKVAYIANRGTYLFPKRAILRMGMLLGESDIAKAVRTQLVNIDVPAPDTPVMVEVENFVHESVEVNEVEVINNTNDDIMDNTFNQTNSNEIKIFSNEQFGKIRMIMINNEPWFVGKDIAESLGYSNASKAVSVHVEEDDKQFIMIDIAHSQNGNVAVGRTKTAIINESGLYSLILSSKLPTAKKFKHWITSEVLPSIRKTGTYIMAKTDENEQQLINNIVQAYLTGNVAEVMAAASVHAKFLRCQNKQLAERNSILEEDNKNLIEENVDLANDKRILTADNALLAEKVLTWTDRSTFVKLISSAAYALRTKEAFLYTDIYKELRCKHHIDLKKRQSLDTKHKNKPLISYMRDYEWKYLYSSLAAMLQSAGINPILVFKQAKAEDKL